MKPVYKGMIIALLHVMIVSSLACKLLYDRANRPRVWALAAPYDPDLPIRGRYVRIQLEVEPRDIKEPAKTGRWSPSQPAVLRAEGGKLVAAPHSDTTRYDSDAARVQFVERQNRKLVVLEQPVAFFIPEHVPDPSRRAEGEQLWVEVTLPRKGPPRPIQLGVKKGDGPIVPLGLN